MVNDHGRRIDVSELTMGQKIKALRKDHNLTLEQVGDAVGVGKSTVRKWENGMISNMRRDKIANLAKVLQTTPAYLMGWDESVTAIETTTKNQLEYRLLETFREMTPEEQQLMASMIKMILDSRK